MSSAWRRWRAGWLLLLRHDDPCAGYRAAGRLRRRQLDLAVLVAGLARRGTWRAAGLATMLGLLLLSLRWRFDPAGRWPDLAVPLLTLLPWLPLLARARRRLLRALLLRTARAVAGAGCGCCNSHHAHADQNSAGTGGSGGARAAGGDRRGGAAGRPR